MERALTVSGNLVEKPGNILLPIGTPVSFIMEHFHIDASKVRLLLSGGPMMGRASFSFESPLTKTSSALLFFDQEFVNQRQENPCIRCGSCARVCPSKIISPDTGEAGIAGLLAPKIRYEKEYCLEDCNECLQVCPSGALQQMDLKLKQRYVIGESLVDGSICVLVRGERDCDACARSCSFDAFTAPRRMSVCGRSSCPVIRGTRLVRRRLNSTLRGMRLRQATDGPEAPRRACVE